MQFDDLQRQWEQLDRKLSQSLTLQAELLRQSVLPPARRRVNRLAIWPAMDVVFCVGALLFAGSRLADHWRNSHLVLPALTFMLCAIALLASSIRQLIHVAELDWSGPVADIQSSLERLRIAKIRQFKWVILLSPLVGFCGLMVGLHALFGWLSGDRVNILEKLNPSWVVANYAFGVLFVPLGYAVARVLARKCHSQRWWQTVLDDVSGKSLNAAALDVERWATLQRDSDPDRLSRAPSRSTQNS